MVIDKLIKNITTNHSVADGMYLKTNPGSINDFSNPLKGCSSCAETKELYFVASVPNPAINPASILSTSIGVSSNNTGTTLPNSRYNIFKLLNPPPKTSSTISTAKFTTSNHKTILLSELIASLSLLITPARNTKKAVPEIIDVIKKCSGKIIEC